LGTPLCRLGCGLTERVALRVSAATHERLLPPCSTISIFNPVGSWSAKWLRVGACCRRGPRALLCVRGLCPCSRAAACAERQVPGCYALSVTDKIAEDVMEQLEE
jgi:hypothetical protein